MNDTIYRQAAIEVIDAVMPVDPNKSEYASGIACGAALAMTYVKQLPPAQPDVPDTNVGDMISKQAAISEIMKDIEDRSLHDDPATPEDYAEGYDEGIRNAAAIVLQMPSAQPEIIRCKDCLNWIPGYITDQDDFIPPKCGKYQQMVGHSSDDYCSCAERRTDG